MLRERVITESNKLPYISRRHKLWSVVITTIILLLVEVLDYVTGPQLNLSIAYFVPIIYAAWAIGRPGAIVTALIAEVSTYTDQVYLIDRGEQSVVGAVSTIIARLLIYLFVAEVTTRLIKTREEAKSAAARAEALAEDLRVAYSILDEDVRAGGLLQAGVLEFTPPSVPGCEIGARVNYAQSVGGDVVDAGALNGHLYAYVGDISGKGTPAALFSLLLKHLLDSAHRRGLRTREVVAALNDDLCQSLPADRFVTLFYADIDPASGNVEYVNAGHPEGVVYRHHSSATELVKPNSSLLGCVQVSTEITTSVLCLRPGDALVLYTDGATEAKRHDGTRLGDDYIIGLVEEYGRVGAQEMAETIIRCVEEATDERWRDDLAIVCIKATERPQGIS